MKILIINSVCGIKSTGRICTDLAEILIKKGHDVKIIYGREMAPNKYKDISIKMGNKLNVLLHGIKSRILDNQGFESKYATKKICSTIQEFDPDIVHLHNLHGYYINIEILFKYLKKLKKPVVWTLHDCWSFTGHCAHFENIKCNKWKTGCEECPLKNEYPSSYFLDNSKKNWNVKKKIFTNLDKIIFVTPSNWLARLFKNSFLNKYPVKVINNGIDTEIFKFQKNDFRNKYHLEKKYIILGVASSWNDTKGFYDFIKLSKYLKINQVIVMVGVTKKQKEILPESIIAIERTDSIVDLANIYSAADVFLNLTYADTYPTTNLEAQACGTPVITYNTGGSIESVPKENIVEQGDLDKVISLLNQKLEIKKQIFDKRILLKKYIEIYNEAIN